MQKILSLDLGDKWIGTAISDSLLLTAKPYETVKLENLEIFLEELIKKENIKEIVIGNPLTLKGTKSAQTLKVIEHKNILEKKFPKIKFILWDERLSSKMAENIKPSKNKDAKIKSHSIAAALILDSYLTFLNLKK